jgi:hypothetical protein
MILGYGLFPVCCLRWNCLVANLVGVFSLAFSKEQAPHWKVDSGEPTPEVWKLELLLGSDEGFW